MERNRKKYMEIKYCNSKVLLIVDKNRFNYIFISKIITVGPRRPRAEAF
jgi:hypothetical protein